MKHQLNHLALVLTTLALGICAPRANAADLTTILEGGSFTLAPTGTWNFSGSTFTLPNTVSGGTSSFATAAQGALATTATQPGDWNTIAKINAATTDDDFVTLAGAQTITGTKNFSNATGTFSGTANLDTLFLDGDDYTAALDTEAATRLAADNRRAFAGGVAFDGTQGYEFSAPPLRSKGSWSISMSFTRDGGYRFLTSSSSPKLNLLRRADGSLAFRMDDGSVTLDATNPKTTPLQNGVIYNALLVHDGVSEESILYIDGEPGTPVDTSTLSDIAFGTGWGVFQLPSTSQGAVEGFLGHLAVFNRALSATEAAELSEIGIETWLAKYPEDKWGGAEGGTYTSDFSASTDTWASNRASLSNITTPVSDGTTSKSDVLKITDTSSTGTHYARKTLLQSGERYRITANYYIPSANAMANRLEFFTDGTQQLFQVTSTGVWASIDQTFTAAGTELWILNKNNASLAYTANGTDATYITDVKITKLGVRAAYLKNEGIGRQLRDLSGRYDALLSATGFQHLKPKTEGYVRVKGAEANPSIMMLEDSNIIPANAVWTQIIAEERIVDIANTAQDLLDRRVRLADSTGDLIIQRSDGTNHATLGTVTTPTDTDDVDVEVHYKQVIR